MLQNKNYQEFSDPFIPSDLAPESILPINPEKVVVFFSFTESYEEGDANDKYKFNLFFPSVLEEKLTWIENQLTIKHADKFQQSPVLSTLKLNNLLFKIRLCNSTVFNDILTTYEIKYRSFMSLKTPT
jgi:hypothetical protein